MVYRFQDFGMKIYIILSPLLNPALIPTGSSSIVVLEGYYEGGNESSTESKEQEVSEVLE